MSSLARLPNLGCLLRAPSYFGVCSLRAPPSFGAWQANLDFEYVATLDKGGASYSSMLRGAAAAHKGDEYLNLYERGPGGYTVAALTLTRFTFQSR